MSNYLVSANDLTTISLGEQDTVASVLQNIAVILSTPKGTVPGYREFGIDISDRITPAQAGVQCRHCSCEEGERPKGIPHAEPQGKLKSAS